MMFGRRKTLVYSVLKHFTRTGAVWSREPDGQENISLVGHKLLLTRSRWTDVIVNPGPSEPGLFFQEITTVMSPIQTCHWHFLYHREGSHSCLWFRYWCHFAMVALRLRGQVVAVWVSCFHPIPLIISSKSSLETCLNTVPGPLHCFPMEKAPLQFKGGNPPDLAAVCSRRVLRRWFAVQS